jgi:hypoxanthine phosphoribosyltransferase
MSKLIPDYFKLLFSKEQIQQAVKAVGKEVAVWVSQANANNQKDVLCIPILRGGIFFFADLVREIDDSVDITPVRTQAYSITQNVAESSGVRFNLDGIDIQNRNILLVDDICDSGKTLFALNKELLKRGALEIKTAVLIKRDIGEGIYNPDFVCFNYVGDEWFVGYGMDDCDRWRNLPDIYIMPSAK